MHFQEKMQENSAKNICTYKQRTNKALLMLLDVKGITER